VAGVPHQPETIRGVQLAPGRPNPAAGTTLIGFTLARAGHVTLTVHDVAGREVKRLLDDAPRDPGAHEVRFDTSALPTGLYLCRLRAGAESVTRKLVIAR
jgi:hypothetical protein